MGGLLFQKLFPSLFKINIMVSKIKNIQSSGTYDSQHGTLYKFEYEFEDGMALMANHKTKESPFKVGDEAEYEVKGQNDYGTWGKVSKPNNDFKGSNFNSSSNMDDDTRQKLITRQSCLKCATEYYSESVPVDPIKVVALAEYFFEYCMTGEVKPKS